MKITKEIFKSFKGLGKLKKMENTGYCNGIACIECPLDHHNLNTSIDCADIIDLDGYAAENPKEMKKMNKVIDIFTKENINAILAKLAPNRNLKYNDYVVYDNKVFKIKGAVKSKSANLILLNGHDMDRAPIYESCIINRKAINKAYTLWVDPSEIFALNDTVILKESNVEYKIVAIAKPDYPILLNGYTDYRVSIDEIKKRDVRCNTPEAYEERYSKWVRSYNIQHK